MTCNHKILSLYNLFFGIINYIVEVIISFVHLTAVIGTSHYVSDILTPYKLNYIDDRLVIACTGVSMGILDFILLLYDFKPDYTCHELFKLFKIVKQGLYVYNMFPILPSMNYYFTDSTIINDWSYACQYLKSRWFTS